MHVLLRSLLVCCALALSAIGATACGSSKSAGSVSRRSSAASPVSTAGSLAPDGDGDSDGPGSRRDNDGDEVLNYGQAAGARDRRVLTALVRHYYAAAAADDGARACSLLYWLAAEMVVEEHEGRNGPPSLRGSTCAQVASKLFAQHHRELTQQIAALEVTEVLVKGNQGLVRLRFAATPERLVAVHRDRGVWKVNVLLDELGV